MADPRIAIYELVGPDGPVGDPFWGLTTKTGSVYALSQTVAVCFDFSRYSQNIQDIISGLAETGQSSIQSDCRRIREVAPPVVSEERPYYYPLRNDGKFEGYFFLKYLPEANELLFLNLKDFELEILSCAAVFRNLAGVSFAIHVGLGKPLDQFTSRYGRTDTGQNLEILQGTKCYDISAIRECTKSFSFDYSVSDYSASDSVDVFTKMLENHLCRVEYALGEVDTSILRRVDISHISQFLGERATARPIHKLVFQQAKDLRPRYASLEDLFKINGV